MSGKTEEHKRYDKNNHPSNDIEPHRQILVMKNMAELFYHITILMLFFAQIYFV
jgi:hypothetical protein